MSAYTPDNKRHSRSSYGGEKSIDGLATAIEVLWETAHDLSSVETVDDTLALVAGAIARAGLYERAVLTLHNEQGDIIAIGHHGVPDEVITAARRARRVSPEAREAILDPANRISESYFIPAELDIELAKESRYIKNERIAQPEGQWQSEDQLFVPLRDPAGSVIGYASVDTPLDNQRPDLATIHALELLVGLVEKALERLRAQGRMDSIESRLLGLIEDSDDVVFRADLVNNSLEYINPAIEKLTGYPADYVLSQSLDIFLKSILHPDDRQVVWPGREVEKQPRQKKNTLQASNELRIRHRDGKYRAILIKRTFFFNDDGRPVTVEGIICDVTDREKLREKLAESERKCRHLEENTRDLVYTRDTDGVFSYLSPSAKHFLEVEPEQALNTRFAEWLTDNPPNQAAFEVSNAAILQGKTVSPFMLEMRTRSGRVFSMEFNERPMRDEKGQVVGVQGVGRDITEHKRAEAVLEKSERRFRELADLLPQTVFEIDLDGNLTYTNRYGLAAFDYARDVLENGINALQLFIPEDGPRIKQNMQRLLKVGESPGHEYTAVRKGGSTFPAMIYSSLIIQDEKPVGFRGILLDLTDRKAAEQALQEEEARYRSLFEESPISMWEEDWSQVKKHIDQLLNTGVSDLRAYFKEHPQEPAYCWSLIKVIGLNKATVERFGAASKEQLLAALNRIATDELLTVNAETIITLQEGQTTFAGENTARRLDGRIIQSDVRLSIVPGHEDDWSKIIVSVIDVTERKRAEEQLINERDFVESLLDTANSLIFCVDKQARITVFNKELEKVTGYTREEVIGKRWPDIFLPKDYHSFKFEDFGEWVRQHPRDSYEGPLVTKSGEVKTILWSNSALCSDDSDEVTAIAVGQDTTDRKQMEKALLNSEQRYHELFNSVMEGIGVVDENENIQYANPAFATIFDEDSPQDLIGKNLLDYIPDDQKELVLAQTEKRRRGENSQYELHIKTAKNVRKTVLASVSHRFDSAGNYIGAFGAVLDITKRKQIEETLQEAREQLNATLNALPDLLFEVDRDGRFYSYRSTCIDLLYTSPEKFLGKVVEEILPAEAAGIIMNALQEAAETGRHTGAVYPLEIQTGVHWFELSIVARGDPKTPEGRFIALARDVTERVKTEEALRKSEAQFRTFAKNIPGVVCIYDEYPDGRREPVYIGPGLEKLLGESLAKKIGNDINMFVDLIVPEDLEELQKAGDRAVASGGVLDFEYRVRVGPDEYRWVRIICRGTPREDGSIRWEGQGFDVTDRREALEALRCSEETSRALLNTTKDSVLLLKPDGTTLAINETAARILGKKPDKLIGSCIYDALPPMVAEVRKTHYNKVIHSGKPARLQDKFAGRKFDSMVYPLFDSAGNVDRLAVFSRNVTERERTLKKLRDKSAELDKANAALEDVITELRRRHERARELSDQCQAKNTELESLISMLAHDLKAPLVSIRELAGLFRRRYAQLIDEGGQGMARRISTNAAQMLRLVESLLDYSRVPDRIGEENEVDLGKLVDEIMEQIIDAFPNRKLVLRRPTQPETLRYSRMALERILANLLRNAVAYVPDDRRPKIEVGWQRSTDQITITVADNGIGIPADEQEKIFELFYRAQLAVSEGSGVGLAIVKKIIDAAHGTISVASQPGEGTVFTVNLPLKPAN